MKKFHNIYALLLILVFFGSCGQSQNKKKITTNIETDGVMSSNGSQSITRNIIQDINGNIWIASFDGVFKYNGKYFTNVTSKFSTARFFSILEDSKGNFWFGSIGSGVYYYDGKFFQNFTIEDGLLNNEVGCIYEDKKGNIWFGVSGGASCYDGKTFQNYIIEGATMNEDRTGKIFSNRRPYEVNSIIEDSKGKLWFGTRDNTFVYDSKAFIVFTHADKPFKNVRTIIEDKKGNIWLGGSDGLWRFKGSTFVNFSKRFVGYIIEDRNGNIWTSSARYNNQGWALSKYDGNTLANQKPMVTEIANRQMIFGILEANDGDIWFGELGGVLHYDGKFISDFRVKEDRK